MGSVKLKTGSNMEIVRTPTASPGIKEVESEWKMRLASLMSIARDDELLKSMARTGSYLWADSTDLPLDEFRPWNVFNTAENRFFAAEEPPENAVNSKFLFLAFSGKYKVPAEGTPLLVDAVYREKENVLVIEAGLYPPDDITAFVPLEREHKLLSLSRRASHVLEPGEFLRVKPKEEDGMLSEFNFKEGSTVEIVIRRQ